MSDLPADARGVPPPVPPRTPRTADLQGCSSPGGPTRNRAGLRFVEGAQSPLEEHERRAESGEAERDRLEDISRERVGLAESDASESGGRGRAPRLIRRLVAGS